jgi:membrane associated rhomboid family serine protease
MIPVRDDNPRRYPPVATWCIIGFTVLVYFYEASLSNDSLQSLIQTFGFVPAQLTHTGIAVATVIPLLTCMFLHGGFLHILGNMWSLWIFGDNVEDRMGPARFVTFYVLCGVAAGLVHWMMNPESTIPTVGASGAISGVMGAYLVLSPRARIIMFLPLLFVPYFFQMPAWVYLAFWFVGQGLSGIETIGRADVGGVAFWAHVGGFVAGIVLCRLFARPGEARRPPQPDEMLPRAAWARGL